MTSRRKRKQRSHATPEAPPHPDKPAEAPCDSRPPVARPLLLGAMTALFVARPLFPSESAVTHGDGLPIVMLWLVLGVCWLLVAAGRPKFIVRFGCTDAAVLLLLACFAAAALWAVHHGSPRPAINTFWEWAALGLCFLLARQLIESRREVRALAAVMIALSVAVAGYGLYQRVYEFPATRAYYNANPDRALREAGLWYPPDSPQRKLYEDRLANTEPMATFALTNSLAGFLAPWLVVLAGIACTEVRNRRRLAGLAILFVPVAVCLFLTHSRSGCLAALLGLAVVWPIARGKLSRFGWKAPAAVLLLGVAAILAAGVAGKIDCETAAKSLGYRLQYWRSSMAMIADHPWLGCGPGNFQAVYTQYKLPEASEEIADPHNLLLEVWSTAGTPAMLALIAVIGCFAWQTCVRGTGKEKEGSDDLQDGEGLLAAAEGQKIEGQDNAWLFVIAGGAAGFLLSAPMGMLCEATPSLAAVALGLPLAVVSMTVLYGWVRDGRLPRLLPAAAVAVLLVNLSAAGGIALAGVAGSFWLLLALGLQGERPKSTRLGWCWLVLGGTIAMTAACYYTAYAPVLGCRRQLRLAETDAARAAEHFRAAAAADTWAAEPQRKLAAAELFTWQLAHDADAYQRFERAAADFVRLSPKAAKSWLLVGDCYSRVAASADPSLAAAARAADAYRRAVELYPNSALHRAKLAEAILAAGEWEAFRREAEMALWLDEVTPHADKKLPDATRRRLMMGLDDR